MTRIISFAVHPKGKKKKGANKDECKEYEVIVEQDNRKTTDENHQNCCDVRIKTKAKHMLHYSVY